MNNCRSTISNIKCEDIDVKLRGYYDKRHSPTVHVLNFYNVHDILRHLIDSMTSLIDNLKLPRLDLGGSFLFTSVIEVQELTWDDSNAHCLLVVQAEYESDLVFDVTKIARLFTSETD